MSQALQNLLAGLKQDNSLKAWSLIITFFGDSIAPRGGAVSASTIQSAMALCGIGSGTVRTALSRLGKDGWVEREKSGRNSFYRLSNKGTQQSIEASANIYARPMNNGNDKHTLYLVVSESGQSLPTDARAASIVLKQNVYLISSTCRELTQLNPQHYIVAEVKNHSLPYWAETALLPESLASKYSQLCERATDICNSSIRSNADAMALRTILIHEWRRLRLRPGQINQTLCHTAQHKAHQIVARLYHELSPGADQWLQQNARGPDGPLQTSDIENEERFR